MITNAMQDQVRALIAECFNNPRKEAARAARAQYIGELLCASLRGDDVDHPIEAAQWLRRLRQLCGVHAGVVDIAHWYIREQDRLLALTGGNNP